MFELPEKALVMRDELNDFFQKRISPNHHLWQKQKQKAYGIWPYLDSPKPEPFEFMMVQMKFI